MKASQIIALGILSATSALIAKPLHQPSIGFEEAIALLKKTPENDFNAVTFYLPEKTPGIKNAYSFLTRKADSTTLIHADDQYIITYEYLTGDPYNAISAVHVWDSKNYQYISSVLYKGYSLTPPSISVGPNGIMVMEVFPNCDRGPGGLFGFSVTSKETELYKYVSAVSAIELAKSGFPLKKKIFAQVPRIQQAQNLNISLSNALHIKKIPQFADFVNLFGSNGEELIKSINFDTLEYTPKKTVKTIPSIESIQGLPEGEEFDYELLDSCNGRYLFIYPKKKGGAHAACLDAAYEKNHNIYLGIYDVARGQLSPAPQSMIDSRSIGTMEYPNIGESDCGNIIINILSAKRWTSLSGPMLFDENTGKTKDIQMDGVAANRYAGKNNIAYKMYGKIPNPESVGTCLSSWNSIPGDDSHSYWLTAGYGVCALYYVDEQKKTGKLVQSWQGHWGKTPWAKETPNPVWIKDKQMLFLPVRDNCWDAYVFHDFSKPAEKKFSIFTGGENDWAIVLPDGRYAGSPGCEKLMVLVKENGQASSAAPYALWKNRPAEVLEAIGGNEEEIATLRATTERWLQKNGLTLDAMPAEPTSGVDYPVITKIDDTPLRASSGSATFSVRVNSGTKKATTAVEVRVNGARIPQSWDAELIMAPGTSQDFSVTVPLGAGQNNVSVTPVDSMGLVGDSVDFRIVREAKSNSTLYVIAMGVSDYANDEWDLKLAAKDAQDIATAFKEYGDGNVQTLVLTNDEVADSSVLDKVKSFLAQSNIEDRVVLYLAGHGILHPDTMEYMFIPAAFSTEKMNGITMDMFCDLLCNIPARERVLMMDTCHSGRLGEAGEEKIASAEEQLQQGDGGNARGMKVRKNTAAKALKTEAQKKRYIEEMFNMGTQYRGINIVAAASGEEKAGENANLYANGFFTHAVIETLKNATTSDSNKDGLLSVVEMLPAIQASVMDISQGKQRPNIVAAETGAMVIASSIADAMIKSDWERVAQYIAKANTAEEALFMLDKIVAIHNGVQEYSEFTTLVKEWREKGRNYSPSQLNELNTAFLLLHPQFSNEKNNHLEDIGSAVWITAMEKGVSGDVVLSYPYNWDHDTGASEIMRSALKHGGNPNATNKYGEPLLLNVSEDLLQVMLEEGADVNARDKNGNTLLHKAFVNLNHAQEHNYRDLKKAMIALNYGADATLRNNEGKRVDSNDPVYTCVSKLARIVKKSKSRTETAKNGDFAPSSLINKKLVFRYTRAAEGTIEYEGNREGQFTRLTNEEIKNELAYFSPGNYSGNGIFKYEKTGSNTATISIIDAPEGIDDLLTEFSYLMTAEEMEELCTEISDLMSLGFYELIFDSARHATATKEIDFCAMAYKKTRNIDVYLLGGDEELSAIIEKAPAPGSDSSLNPERLQNIITELQTTEYNSAAEQLYKARLLAVLPVILKGGNIDTNVDTVRKKSNGTTALHNACGLGHFELVKWLLYNGASVHARATNGATPEQCVSNDPDGRIQGLLQQYK